MAISTSVDIKAAQVFPQETIRDPLGVWGARLAVTGDASGAGIKVAFSVPAQQRSAWVLTAYHAQVAQTVGTGVAPEIKCRLLSNWPDVDPLAGVQGFSSLNFVIAREGTMSAPFAGPGGPLINPNDRFILLYDPRPGIVALSIAELEISTNVLNDVWIFEMYGYYWDRSVMQAPGGPRHPGAN